MNCGYTNQRLVMVWFIYEFDIQNINMPNTMVVVTYTYVNARVW